MIVLPFLTAVLAVSGGWPALRPYKSGWMESVGNHRFSIWVNNTGASPEAVYVEIPWRRRDTGAYTARDLVVVSGANHLETPHCLLLANTTATTARVVFTANTGHGRYYAYYLPFHTCGYAGGSCHSKGSTTYDANTHCASKQWWTGEVNTAAYAEEYQARSDFSAFTEMEIPASGDEVAALLARCFPGDPLAVMAEVRERVVRMWRELPLLWTQRACGELTSFSGSAQPGEAYTLQVAVYAVSTPVEVTSVSFSDFAVEGGGEPLPAAAFSCMNTNVTDYWGRVRSNTQTVAPRTVLALWMRTAIPKSTTAARYTGRITVHTSEGDMEVPAEINVAGAVLEDSGDSEWWRGTRLAWLDSTDFSEEIVPAPYTAVSVSSTNTTLAVEMLGKTLTVNDHGMLYQATVRNDATTGAAYVRPATDTLASPITFNVVSRLSGPRPYTYNLTRTSTTSMKASWTSTALLPGGEEELRIEGSADATGYTDYTVTFTNKGAEGDLSFELLIPNSVNNSVLGMGLGVNGGALKNFGGKIWSWDGINGNNGVWIGTTRAGVRVSLKGESDLWQAAEPYDSHSAPPTPESWGNAGKGGVTVAENGTVSCFTGFRTVKKNGVLTFKFSVMITPVRPMDLKKHFNSRYAQLSGPANYSFLAEGGATVVNIHQGNELNPWINYPYLTNGLLKDASDAAHAVGMKFKVYNTMRELSNHALEIFPMRSLNETFVYTNTDPSDDGASYLQEHLQDKYEVAWAQFVKPSSPLPNYFPYDVEQDAAIKVLALSRWNNYYVKGLHQIVKDYGCDGIYLDEIAYDRITMLRARNALGPDALIDTHSYCKGATYSPAMRYMELYPFIDSLWYGENFKYDSATPEYWLAEISGIPFGLNSDMLRYTGETSYPYRGMLHASANRWQCGQNDPVGSCPFDPRAVWQIWKSFDIEASVMYGWWLQMEDPSFAVPVTTSTVDVKVTSYLKGGGGGEGEGEGEGLLIVVASFKTENTTVVLDFDYALIGMNEGEVALSAPAMKPMQPQEQKFASPSDPIPITQGSGLILLLLKK